MEIAKCEDKKGKGFQEINVNLGQVCGAVSKAEEEELCSKQLELVVGKLSQPGVSASTMSDCMVRILLHFTAFVNMLSWYLLGTDHPYGTFGV